MGLHAYARGPNARRALAHHLGRTPDFHEWLRGAVEDLILAFW
ncbi:hypothetical protein [Terrabacter lapilli]